MKLYIRNNLVSSNALYPGGDISSLQINWDAMPGVYYTIIMYDVDSPYPSQPSTAPYIHLLVTNIPGNDISKGQQLFGYMPPSPPSDSQPHRYVIGLYSQRMLIPTINLSNRAMFPLNQFISQYGLHFMESETIVYDPIQTTFYVVAQEPTITYNPAHPLIRGDTTLTESEQNFCSCVVDVAEKQPGACNLEKAWFEYRDLRMCYNPFATCAKSTGTSSRKCYENYNYQEFSDLQLTALANLSQIPTGSPIDRSGVIGQLMSRSK
jgi:phosphatidylethanolamine-binding protein (PEBP) family uncharacterized protein